MVGHSLELFPNRSRFLRIFSSSLAFFSGSEGVYEVSFRHLSLISAHSLPSAIYFPMSRM